MNSSFDSMWNEMRSKHPREYFIAWASRNVAEAEASREITKEQYQTRKALLSERVMRALYPPEGSGEQPLGRELADRAVSLGKIHWQQEQLQKAADKKTSTGIAR